MLKQCTGGSNSRHNMNSKQKVNGLCSELKKLIPRLEQNWDGQVPNMNKKFVPACYCVSALRLHGVHI